jgi:hypothetical protein
VRTTLICLAENQPLGAIKGWLLLPLDEVEDEVPDEEDLAPELDELVELPEEEEELDFAPELDDELVELPEEEEALDPLLEEPPLNDDDDAGA